MKRDFWPAVYFYLDMKKKYQNKLKKTIVLIQIGPKMRKNGQSIEKNTKKFSGQCFLVFFLVIFYDLVSVLFNLDLPALPEYFALCAS